MCSNTSSSLCVLGMGNSKYNYRVQGAAHWILGSPSRHLTETSCRMFMRHSISLERFSSVRKLTGLPGSTL